MCYMYYISHASTVSNILYLNVFGTTGVVVHGRDRMVVIFTTTYAII